MKKLEILFDVYDLDKSGYLDKEEISKVLPAMFHLFNYTQDRNSVQSLVNQCFEILDKSKDGKIEKSKKKTMEILMLPSNLTEFHDF